jgi:hypothetical protein
MHRWPQHARISAEAGVKACKNSLFGAKSLKYREVATFAAEGGGPFACRNMWAIAHRARLDSPMTGE